MVKKAELFMVCLAAVSLMSCKQMPTSDQPTDSSTPKPALNINIVPTTPDVPKGNFIPPSEELIKETTPLLDQAIDKANREGYPKCDDGINFAAKEYEQLLSSDIPGSEKNHYYSNMIQFATEDNSAELFPGLFSPASNSSFITKLIGLDRIFKEEELKNIMIVGFDTCGQTHEEISINIADATGTKKEISLVPTKLRHSNYGDFSQVYAYFDVAKNEWGAILQKSHRQIPIPAPMSANNVAYAIYHVNSTSEPLSLVIIGDISKIPFGKIPADLQNLRTKNELGDEETNLVRDKLMLRLGLTDSIAAVPFDELFTADSLPQSCIDSLCNKNTHTCRAMVEKDLKICFPQLGDKN